MPNLSRRNRRSSKGSRRNPKVSKTWAYSRKSANAQSKQIVTLQKQITRIKRRVKGNIQWSQYAYSPGSVVHNGGTTAPVPAVQALVSPSTIAGVQTGWTRVFNSTAGTEDNIKWQGKHMQLEYCYELSNPAVSGTPITITTFVVSLRPELANQVLQETNGLVGTDLVEGEHYQANSMGTVQGSGMVFINRSMFKVHHVSRCTIGHETNFISETNTTGIRDNRYRRYVKIPYKCLLKGDGSGTSASWLSLTSETIQRTDQRYFLTFANNYGSQGLQISLNCLFTGQTTQ